MNGSLSHVHEVFQSPELLSVAERELDLKPQGIIVDELICSQGEVGAEQQHVSALACAELGFEDDDDVQRLAELLMESLTRQGLACRCRSG